MTILVIGGTVFLGRHFAEAAVVAGHAVTLFHRGSKGGGIVDGVEELFGDRDGDLAPLGERTWDAVVDTCGYVPRVVRKSVETLRDRTSRYLFVSTISAYDLSGQLILNEDSPISTIDDPSIEEVTGESYGPLKFLCEEAVRDGFGERALIIRPGLINGPYDPSNRFTYWVTRFAEGGDVLVPDRPDQPMQLVDVRDLAAFMLLALENQFSGTFNVCGSGTPRTLSDMIAACRSLNPDAEPIWAPRHFLTDQGVELWQEMPLVLSPDEETDVLFRTDCRRAIEAGLNFRPWEATAKDTLEWSKVQPPEGKPRHGLDRAKEIRVLEAFRAQSQIHRNR